MRALWHGYRIAVHVAGDAPTTGVATPDDLERVRRLFASVMHYAALLADAHPLVIATTPTGEKYNARGIQPTRD